MLPRHHRLHRSADFATVVRSGASKGRRTVVVHAAVDRAPEIVGGPRFGLVVSRAVGDSVTRHRVSRRLRHVLGRQLGAWSFGPEMMVVVRANPAAARADSETLERDVAAALPVAVRKALQKAAPPAPVEPSGSAS